MKKLNPRMKKVFIITALSGICVLLAISIFSMFGGESNKTELSVATQDTKTDVSVGAIQNDQKAEPSITVPEVVTKEKEEVIDSKPNDIELTQTAKKPQPPEKPAIVVGTDKPHDVPQDTSLTNPDKKPIESVKPVEPTKDKPAGGETNSKGETYVPGFGWVKDSGPNVGEKSYSDGDWDKQIGNMN